MPAPDRPTCVVLTSIPPAPGVAGASTRVAATIDALAIDHDVTVVVVRHARLGPGLERHLPAAIAHCESTGVVLVATHPRTIPGWRRMLHLLTGGSGRRWERLVIGTTSPSVSTVVSGVDLVWVFKVAPMLHAVVPRHPALVLDLDDLRDRVMPRSTWRQRLEIAWFRRHRARASARARRVLLCSEVDRDRFGSPALVDVLPNTAPAPLRLLERSPGAADVLMVGSMGYRPNAEGARWFVEHVWPRIVEQVPHARFRVAGDPGTAQMEDLGRVEGVDLLGFVDDLRAEMQRAAVTVAPLLSGTGTRVKILEAFANRMPVVSTSVGAEGLRVEHGRHLVLADGPDAFADAVIDVLTDRVKADELGSAGRSLYDERYSIDRFTEQVRRIASDARLGRV